MRFNVVPLATLVVVGLLIPLAGCGGPKEIVCKGKVTYDGKPVETGEIIFIQTTDGLVGAGQITNGEYTLVAPGTGQLQVKITANKVGDKPAPDGLPNYIPYIPAKYNDKTKLTADVEDKPENTINFELEK
ncbi:hypothetical protein [Blastopirellula marina]|uniref:hypothetical protein n=1 Tax=Blastopirellula marina TaxID=124 RepID=UPI0011B033FA|nr:hypothetical protein [Blastopirellula marina]